MIIVSSLLALMSIALVVMTYRLSCLEREARESRPRLDAHRLRIGDLDKRCDELQKKVETAVKLSGIRHAEVAAHFAHLDEMVDDLDDKAKAVDERVQTLEGRTAVPFEVQCDAVSLDDLRRDVTGLDDEVHALDKRVKTLESSYPALPFVETLQPETLPPLEDIHDTIAEKAESES